MRWEMTPLKLAYSIWHQDMRELVLEGANSMRFQEPGWAVAELRIKKIKAQKLVKFLLVFVISN